MKSPVKFVNLRNLKKCLHLYMDEELHINSSKFTLINLRSIAFEDHKEDLIKLVEMVFCALISSPKAEQLVNKMRKFDESTQQRLKFTN